jgi:hypothetical protein
VREFLLRQPELVTASTNSIAEELLPRGRSLASSGHVAI